MSEEKERPAESQPSEEAGDQQPKKPAQEPALAHPRTENPPGRREGVVSDPDFRP
jgi:hypothetical protein